MWITTILNSISCFIPLQPIGTTGRYFLRYNPQENDGIVTCRVITLKFRPSVESCRGFIEKDINDACTRKIETGHTITIDGEEKTVYLSLENQLNYKAALDRASQSKGANLPFRIKVGSGERTAYVEFTTTDKLREFWNGCTDHINTCLQECWDLKNSIDYSQYELPE